MAELTPSMKIELAKTQVETFKESALEYPIQAEIKDGYAKLAILLGQAAANDPALKPLAATAGEMAEVDHHDRKYDRTFDTQPVRANAILKAIGAVSPTQQEVAFDKAFDTRRKEDALDAAAAGIQQNSKIPSDLKAQIDNAFKETRHDRDKMTFLELHAETTAPEFTRVEQAKTPEELNAVIKAKIDNLIATARAMPKDIKDIPGSEIQTPGHGGAKGAPAEEHQKDR